MKKTLLVVVIGVVITLSLITCNKSKSEANNERLIIISNEALEIIEFDVALNIE